MASVSMLQLALNISVISLHLPLTAHASLLCSEKEEGGVGGLSITSEAAHLLNVASSQSYCSPLRSPREKFKELITGDTIKRLLKL